MAMQTELLQWCSYWNYWKENNPDQYSEEMETMAEATKSLWMEGRNPLMRIVKAGEGSADWYAHFGAWLHCILWHYCKVPDYGPIRVCDFAHHMTKVALGGTNISIRQGYQCNAGTFHREEKLNAKQKENQNSVHHAWKIGYHHTMHLLINGFIKDGIWTPHNFYVVLCSYLICGYFFWAACPMPNTDWRLVGGGLPYYRHRRYIWWCSNGLYLPISFC